MQSDPTTPPKRIWKCAGCGLRMPGNCDCVTNVATSWEPDHRMVRKDQLRMETTSEHIARDMSEGRFPERSDPQVIVIPEAERKMILASEAEAMVAAALEPVMDLLMEPVATHTDSDWLDRKHDLLAQVTSAPAAAALDKLIAEAEARVWDHAAQIGGDAAVEVLLRHEPDASPLKIQMTRQAIANPIRRAAKGAAK